MAILDICCWLVLPARTISYGATARLFAAVSRSLLPSLEPTDRRGGQKDGVDAGAVQVTTERAEHWSGESRLRAPGLLPLVWLSWRNHLRCPYGKACPHLPMTQRKVLTKHACIALSTAVHPLRVQPPGRGFFDFSQSVTPPQRQRVAPPRRQRVASIEVACALLSLLPFFMFRIRWRYMRLGIASKLCNRLVDRPDRSQVTNDIFTREDAEFLTKNSALEEGR